MRCTAITTARPNTSSCSTAAYFGLKKRAALADFRERFLIRDAEQGLNTSVDPMSLIKALGGGVNDIGTFAD